MSLLRNWWYWDDLRDAELDRMNIGRDQVVSSSAEHYPCTRRLATRAVERRHGGVDIHGLTWHSRHAELAGLAPPEVVVFREPRFRTRRGRWPLVAPGVRSLSEGPGRTVVDRVAEQLGAVVLPQAAG